MQQTLTVTTSADSSRGILLLHRYLSENLTLTVIRCAVNIIRFYGFVYLTFRFMAVCDIAIDCNSSVRPILLSVQFGRL